MDKLTKLQQLAKDGSTDEIGNVQFSDGTYQIQVHDRTNQQNYWPFLQFDDHEQLTDCFCSCDEATTPCKHLIAAYAFIFNKQSVPLHTRFHRSIWYALTHYYAEESHYKADALKKSRGALYRYLQAVEIQSLTQTGKATLHHILVDRPPQTEETSLKFSNLSQEELQKWKKGEPLPKLQYELSAWSDLAKWLFLMQERGTAYQLRFEKETHALPTALQIAFPELSCRFALPPALLERIIPTLGSVDSPLKLKGAAEQGISKVVYQPAAGCLVVHEAPFLTEIQNKKSDAQIIGEWLYVPEEGFYPRHKHALLLTPLIGPLQLSKTLSKYWALLQRLLENCALDPKPHPLRYTLRFDAEWQLHITAYIAKPGDLSTPHARLFGQWVYLESKGFVRIADKLFESLAFVVPPAELSEFVQRHRHWLNSFAGFRLHLAAFAEEISYRVLPTGDLEFLSHIELPGETQAYKDFGDWIYLPGEGFYPKAQRHEKAAVHPGLIVKQAEVGSFIQKQNDELSQVRNFFAAHCPVISCSLSIQVKEQQIALLPKFHLKPGYFASHLTFYGHYVYCEAEGFSLLPLQARPPEKYQKELLIPHAETANFVRHELPRLAPFISSLDSRLTLPTTLQFHVEQIERAEESVRLATNLTMVTNLGRLSYTEIWQAVQRGESYLFSPAGLIDLQQEAFLWLKEIAPQQVNLTTHQIHLSTIQWWRFDTLFAPEKPSTHTPETEKSRHLLSQLRTLSTPEPPNLSGLGSTLRDYQKAGLNWLWFLYHYRLGALLCDDMGLGKTHQAMALLAAAVNSRKAHHLPSKPFLVVCPTSVIYHWEDKLKEFLPHLRIYTFYGLERNLNAFTGNYDLILTSYGILRLERQGLAQIPFEIAIYDEIQAAKNQESQTHLACTQMQASFSLGLTGTPIENQLSELHALFEIILPAYLPDTTSFRNHYLYPIERFQDPARKQQLKRLIKPFILRRKKEEVLLDLPEKTEEFAHCDLSPQQRHYYSQVLQSYSTRLLPQLSDTQSPIPYIHILAALSKLKQICNHPAVYLGEPHRYKEFHSGKWELFTELLSEARASSQKVVVFSQYLHMLDIIESHLKEQKICYAALRGNTQDRRTEIQRFQNDPHCAVFVGSLLASGFGIDLTAASVVIHYDRWWTAARENQATDRVHRIGQTRGVQVFKLITRKTLEEKIDKIISRKGALLETIVGSSEVEELSTLTREELIELLSN